MYINELEKRILEISYKNKLSHLSSNLTAVNIIDEIYCISVNDAFVMNEWARQLGIKKVKMLADGNGDFTRLMGMLVSKSAIGFGMRSHRYAAVLTDMVREKLFTEPGRYDNAAGDPYGESSPKNVLKYLKAL